MSRSVARWSSLTALLMVVGIVALPASAGAAGYSTGFYSWLIAGKLGQSCGGGTPLCSDGSDALSGKLGGPEGLALDADGNVYIADYFDGLVRRVSPTGALTTLTTNGEFKAVRDPSDSPETLNGPTAVALAPNGTLYVSVDPGGGSGGQVFRISGGVRSLYAGSGDECVTATTDPCGDGQGATIADLNSAASIALDGAGNLYIADDEAHKIRKVTAATGKISTVAGRGAPCGTTTAPTTDPTNPCGDNGSAVTAELDEPGGVTVTADGATVYIADTADYRVRKVTAGVITTVAGSGSPPSCSCTDEDNGPATGVNVGIDGPIGVALDAAGNLFVAEIGSGPGLGRVRMISPGGIITTVAGGGGLPFGGQSVSMGFYALTNVISDRNGGLLVSDSGANVVYWITPSKPLGIPGPKGDKGDTGATGPKGDTGTGGVRGPAGAKGEPSPLATWVCRKRKHGIGRYAVTCFTRIFADDGAKVTVRLMKAGKMLASDSDTAADENAQLHLRSRSKLNGVYSLRITIDPRRGPTTVDSIRVVI